MASERVLPLKDILFKYTKRGWHLFPIRRETKRPAIENNLKAASDDIDQLMRWAKEFPNCNWGLSLAKSGLVAVDVDQDGLDPWAEYEFEYGEPETLKAQSGSGIGSHYVFKARPGARYRGKIKFTVSGEKLGKGIDVKHNGYIAVYPSIHPTTKRKYTFVNRLKIVEPPEWLAKRIEKDGEQKLETSEPKYKLSNRFYTKIIEQLKTKTFGYDEWLRMGMALHAAFEGSDEGLELYLSLTEGENYRDGDLETARDKWASFQANNSGISGGTFVHLARELECEIPNPDFEKDLELFEQASKEDGDEVPDNDERNEEPQWYIDRDGQKYSVHKKFVVDELNKNYAVLLGGGQGSIIYHYETEDKEKHVHVLKPERFRTALAPVYFKEIIEYDNRPLTWKLHPVSTLWLKSNFRQTFDDIVFEPNPKGNVLNLWTGIPCERIEGDYSLVIEFIRSIICGEDEKKLEYILDWLAHLVQKPEEKAITVPVLIGEQGTGKGLFTDGILRGILKTRYIRIDKPGQIMERFNVEQSKKFATVLDEASWRGNFDLANVMKSLTGNDTMTVEEKHGGRYSIMNYTRYVLTTNDKEPVFLEPTNRRYLIFELSSLNIRDVEYYGRIWDKLKDGKLAEHFYDFLMGRDLSNFNAKRFPVELDNLGHDTKVASMGAVGAFWYDSLFENPRPMFQGAYLQKEHVYESFLDYCDRTRQWQKGLSRQRFWRDSRNLIPILGPRETRFETSAAHLRAYRVYPNELAENFCKRNRLTMPKDFDDLELLLEGDFADPIPEIETDES